MNNFIGVIIEESLENKDVLKKVKILKTRVEKVTDEHQTPYLENWTLHMVEVEEGKAHDVAEEISRSLDSEHNDWYADFKNDSIHFIIFKGKIFKLNRENKEQYDEVINYGLSLGIPKHQLDFSPDILEKEW